MVLKPSELAPLSCLLLGQMCVDAGLPVGALNVVSGLGPSAGAPLAGMLLLSSKVYCPLSDTSPSLLLLLNHSVSHVTSAHDDIDKISFTGSAPTARKIMMAAALGPRGLSLELGGKSPLVVFEDADVEGAVDWICTG